MVIRVDWQKYDLLVLLVVIEQGIFVFSWAMRTYRNIEERHRDTDRQIKEDKRHRVPYRDKKL